MLLLVALLALPAAARGQETRPATAPTAETQPAVREVARPVENGWFAKPDPKVMRKLPELPAEITKSVVIPIHGMINGSLYDAVRRKVIRAHAQGAQLIIFDLDTPGGELGAAQEIVDLIRTELAEVRTVAFVNSMAMSAGAYITLFCDQIVMTPYGKFGDAAPITMNGELPDTAKAKVVSFLRGEFRIAAEQHGYPQALVEGMIDRNVEVWLVQNVNTGEKRYVLRDDASKDVQFLPDRPDLAPKPDKPWKVLRVVLPKGELLTVTRSEAQEFGFLHAGVDDLAGVRKLYNITREPEMLTDTWSERVAAFLTSPTVTALLVLGLLFFGYIEVQHPGVTVPGAIAVACLVLLVGSRYVAGLAQVWEIVLFFIGLILLLVEIFVTPGFGVAGIIGGILCLVGLLAMLVAAAPGEWPYPHSPLMREHFLSGLFAVIVGFLAGVALCIITARFLPRMPVANRLMLAELKTAPDTPASEKFALRQIAPGAIGVVEALCRPVGIARFGEVVMDVVAEGEFIPRGTSVVVMRNEGNRLIVRPVKRNT